MVANLKMDWIRRNLFFNRKTSNKSSVEVKNDDEFIDIVDGEEVKITEVDVETVKPAAVKKKKPRNSNVNVEVTGNDEERTDIEPFINQIIENEPADNETSPSSIISDQGHDNRQFYPAKPKNTKKKLNLSPNTQIRNNIIHQPR